MNVAKFSFAFCFFCVGNPMLPFSCCRPLLARCINHSSLLATPLANILSSSSSIGGGAKVGHRREKEKSPKIGKRREPLKGLFFLRRRRRRFRGFYQSPFSLSELWRGFILKGLEHFFASFMIGAERNRIHGRNK